MTSVTQAVLSTVEGCLPDAGTPVRVTAMLDRQTARPIGCGSVALKDLRTLLNHAVLIVQNGFRAALAKTFKRGDRVEWNSEAGRVRGTVMRRVVSDTRFKGYVHHASKEEAQYIIKSEKTDHIAIHKGKALKWIRSTTARHRRLGGKHA